MMDDRSPAVMLVRQLKASTALQRLLDEVICADSVEEINYSPELEDVYDQCLLLNNLMEDSIWTEELRMNPSLAFILLHTDVRALGEQYSRLPNWEDVCAALAILSATYPS